ncbi:MAG: YkgJ family cysteine cluster protein [Deltaproteobacteria bacterium]|nr:YkgJ family cysteine cluster protein [Deltaproteobacteria bacterium]
MEKATIFLTTQEAIQGIIADFRQYEPQIILFSGIIRLITDNQIHLKRAPEKNGAWINRSNTTQMKWLNGPELVKYMCDIIAQTRWNPNLLASACARVFQTRAVPGIHPNTGKSGVRIETNMEAFACRQCGSCCFLDYHNEVTAEDVAIWRKLGRNDILKWVYEIRCDGQSEKSQAWVVPGTLKQAETCPFLDKESESRRWRCRIHDVKPAICRQYPLNRKHAVMSGCRGFKK